MVLIPGYMRFLPRGPSPPLLGVCSSEIFLLGILLQGARRQFLTKAAKYSLNSFQSLGYKMSRGKILDCSMSERACRADRKTLKMEGDFFALRRIMPRFLGWNARFLPKRGQFLANKEQSMGCSNDFGWGLLMCK